jgi:hypothetical protein
MHHLYFDYYYTGNTEYTICPYRIHNLPLSNNNTLINNVVIGTPK